MSDQITDRPLRVAIGIATTGRPAILAEVIEDLRHQTYPIETIVVCHAKPGDVDGLPEQDSLLVFQGRPGSAHQRNAILDRLDPDLDVVLFLDDDFFLEPRYVEHIVRAFMARPDAVATTGRLLADGASGPGIQPDEAARLIGDFSRAHTKLPLDWHLGWSCYGCNFAARLSTIRAHQLRFDEKLPLYAWYEDIDFSRRLAAYGHPLRVESATGVHLGIKKGRTSGLRLGYSQIANSYYLARKGTYPWKMAIKSMARHTLKNAVYSVRPEPFIDRRGRARGNLRAWIDILRGRSDPERILSFT